MGADRLQYTGQAQVKSARDYHHGLSDPSRPCKLGMNLCQYEALRTKVSLVGTSGLQKSWQRQRRCGPLMVRGVRGKPTDGVQI